MGIFKDFALFWGMRKELRAPKPPTIEQQYQTELLSTQERRLKATLKLGEAQAEVTMLKQREEFLSGFINATPTQRESFSLGGIRQVT